MMTHKDMLATDRQYFDLAMPEALAPLLEVVDRFAADAEHSKRGPALSPEQRSQLLERLQELDLPGLLLAAEDELVADAPLTLFLIAETLAAVCPELAWRGLAPITAAAVARLAGTVYPTSHVQALQLDLFIEQGTGRGRQWLALSPWPAPASTGALVLDWQAAQVLGPLTAAELQTGWKHETKTGLLGFAGACQQTLRAADIPGRLQPQQWTPATADNARRWLWGLHGGLLCGVQRAQLRHGMDYAKTRQAFGKPIYQHQAISLRLADMALAADASRLYLLQTLTDQDAACREAGGGSFIVETAHQLARDAVQIAAAHGYVDGLPFKRLFEQARTLAMLFASLTATPGGE
ncbi:acyl-CoA dehydrogenase family protein [Parachitinimonas caeni]|uniref:Acyl-CoA dehydrogenase family protein n=1 Tax=Parachitinimonas caeni TaxID=3031301 RepID=A0ABT7E0U7_9NEIS|nr:acyl-CoA dehydrogenase family protein [Parachitinimonas caeni]MDK2125945.1 acyl-CoA dehydrogenase family protein [Parachitinimonas caeni]